MRIKRCITKYQINIQLYTIYKKHNTNNTIQIIVVNVKMII